MTDGGRRGDINVAARHAIALLTQNSRSSSIHVAAHASRRPGSMWLHGAMTGDAYRSPCRVFNGRFAPNIAAQPTVAASRKRSFGPRVGSTAAEAFPRSRMPRHTSATRKHRSFANALANASNRALCCRSWPVRYGEDAPKTLRSPNDGGSSGSAPRPDSQLVVARNRLGGTPVHRRNARVKVA